MELFHGHKVVFLLMFVITQDVHCSPAQGKSGCLFDITETDHILII